jgi:dTDP-4-dehydrorhamnose 3,5-epimerase
MDVRETAIAGLWQVAAKSITDERGTVREFFRSTGFSELGVTVSSRWTQINLTWTARGAIRGLHGEAITKLVGVASGAAHGVYLDARKGSPTYGKVVTVPLEVGLEMLVPPGVCNGFQALSEGGCQYLYCFDAEWTPGMAGTSVNPLDPALGIDWPLPVDAADPAAISHKDATAPLFAELA